MSTATGSSNQGAHPMDVDEGIFVIFIPYFYVNFLL